MHGTFTHTPPSYHGEHIDFDVFPDAAGGTSKRWSLKLDGRLMADKLLTTWADLKRDVKTILVQHLQEKVQAREQERERAREQEQEPGVLRLKGSFVLRPVHNNQESWELYLTRNDGQEVLIATGDGRDLPRIEEALLELHETLMAERQAEREAERGRGPTPRPEEVHEMWP